MGSQTLVYFFVLAAIFFLVASHDGDGHYTNDWVVRLIGGKDVVDQLAMELDYQNLGELKGFPNTYLMRKNDHPQRSRRNALHLTKRLADDNRVEWAEQQIAKNREKREFSDVTPDFIRKTTQENTRFNDFLWPDQWYLHDTRNLADVPELDMRTIPVWNMGYTGKGIVVTIMDDARCKKPHTIAEELILPAAIEIVETMFGDNFAKELQSIPLSNDTVSRRIDDIAEDVEQQLFGKLRDKLFLIQLDEAKDSNKDAHFIAYVRFWDGKCVEWKNCVGICTDGARTMSGIFKSIQALVKQKSPLCIWTHCMIHREALASKEIIPGLNIVLMTVVTVVNYIKMRPLKSRIFSGLGKDMGAVHSSLLFYCEARWLSRGKFLQRVYELRNEITIFLEEENLPEAEKFRDSLFLMKLSYLVDIFEKLNILNLQLQGSNVHMFDTSYKINAFCRKLELWSRNLKQKKNLEVFENADKCVKTYKNEEQHVEVVYKTIEYHLAMLAKNFKKYFFAEDNLIASYEWVRGPFQNTPEGLSTTEEESFIDFASSGEIKRQFCNKTLFKFWAEVDEEFSELKTKAFRILLPFSTSYLCETRFSAVTALKTKYRSQLNIEKELRVSISNFKPSFENLCSARQAHGSH
ncbi:SCAN domain-containing protein 3 [Trichonephila clavipes]|nr:SCAN domain-containing protein 3 [Trichonephila clavipes]